MRIRTVVVGSCDPARAIAVTDAIAGRCATATSTAWPPERAVRSGRDASTAAIVLDDFPSGDTLRAIARVTALRPDLGILVLGPLAPTVEPLIALASGASGYLPSHSDAATVADAVDTLLTGDAVLPRSISGSLLQQLRAGGGVTVTAADRAPARLTSREWQVLVLLRQEHSTAEIARRLVLSKGTVRTHVSALGRKLGGNRQTLGMQLAAG